LYFFRAVVCVARVASVLLDPKAETNVIIEEE